MEISMIHTDMQKDYQLLTSSPVLGFYNCCEITTAFLWEKTARKARHYFTIAVFEERLNPVWKKKCLTPHLIPISDTIAFGIERRVLSLDSAKEVFECLCHVSGQNTIDIGSGKLLIGSIEAVPKVFVPPDGDKNIPLNKLLKNNFINGSYLLEFFDVTKSFYKTLPKNLLNTVSETLNAYLPIDLFSIPDRIGNFIFQFPSLNVRVSYSQGSAQNTLLYHVFLNPRIGSPEQFRLLSEIQQDGNIIGFGTFLCQGEQTTMELPVENSGRLCRTTLLEQNSQLILNRREVRKMTSYHLNVRMDFPFGSQRRILDTDGKNPVFISVKSSMEHHIRSPYADLRSDPIQSRQYSERMKVLDKQLEFCQYNAGDRAQALNDIRELMNRPGYKKYYLWDPYLTVEGLLDTWYYTETYGVPLYAITSKKAIKGKSTADKPCVSEWIQRQRTVMEERSNHYGIQLEFRCQWGLHGYHFHDRFLISIPDEGMPKAWSLGTSINSLGTSHHILQSVAHPQLIADAFEALWSELAAEECIIWKSGCNDEK